MDSEIKRIYSAIGLAMMILILIVLRFTSSSYLFLFLAICLVLGMVLSFLGAILLSWGKKYNISYFLTCCFIFCGAPLISAYLINYGIISPLKTHGYLTPIHISLYFIIPSIVYIYIKNFENYKWKTYYIEDEDLNIEITSTCLIGTKPIDYAGRFFYKSKIFDNNRISTKRKRWEGIPDQYIGMPNAFHLTYFSEKENQFYKGEFILEKKQIRRLMRYSIFFPFIRTQKYNHINLIILPEGKINLQLGNTENDITFYEGRCGKASKNELVDLNLKTSKKDNLTSNFKDNNYILNNDLELLRKQKVSIKHSITGLTNKIVSISAITASGEHYTLKNKVWNNKVWNNKVLLQTPIVLLNFIIINNKGQKLTWLYTYDLKDIASHFNVKKPNTINEIEYQFHLYANEENLLQATSFEYIDKEKKEFKLNMDLTKISILD